MTNFAKDQNAGNEAFTEEEMSQLKALLEENQETDKK